MSTLALLLPLAWPLRTAAEGDGTPENPTVIPICECGVDQWNKCREPCPAGETETTPPAKCNRDTDPNCPNTNDKKDPVPTPRTSPRPGVPPTPGSNTPGAGDGGDASTPPGSRAGDGSVPEAATNPSSINRSGSRAIGSAGRMADEFSRSLNQEQDLPGGGPAREAAASRSRPGGSPAGQATGVAGGMGGSGPPTDPTNPATPQDLAVASRSGFKGSFEAVGLKMGWQADIVRADGSPATMQDLDNLRNHIKSEPTALMWRPDFFDVIPRESFADLKRQYTDRPELAQEEFKHIELSESNRDFLRSKSCVRMSGNCNRYGTQASYRRGEYVPPEDLSNIWSKLRSEDGADPSRPPAAEDGAPARGSERAVPKGLLSSIFGARGAASFANKIKSALNGLGSLFGASSDAEASVSPPSRSGSRGGTAAAAVVMSASQRRGQPASPPNPGLKADQAGRSPFWRLALWAASILGGISILVAGLRRKREPASSDEQP